MSEISEVEIKAMSKEQNYLRGYSDGKLDTLDKIRGEIEKVFCMSVVTNELRTPMEVKTEILQIIDKHVAESEDA